MYHAAHTDGDIINQLEATHVRANTGPGNGRLPGVSENRGLERKDYLYVHAGREADYGVLRNGAQAHINSHPARRQVPQIRCALEASQRKRARRANRAKDSASAENVLGMGQRQRIYRKGPAAQERARWEARPQS